VVLPEVAADLAEQQVVDARLVEALVLAAGALDAVPARASVVTCLLPIVSVALGAAVLDEHITLTVIAGTAVILLGVALTRRQVE
jgi:drug/metabolite transporter (DMT)-like permease